jgi:hypothetical protein
MEVLREACYIIQDPLGAVWIHVRIKGSTGEQDSKRCPGAEGVCIATNMSMEKCSSTLSILDRNNHPTFYHVLVRPKMCVSIRERLIRECRCTAAMTIDGNFVFWTIPANSTRFAIVRKMLALLAIERAGRGFSSTRVLPIRGGCSLPWFP